MTRNWQNHSQDVKHTRSLRTLWMEIHYIYQGTTRQPQLLAWRVDWSTWDKDCIVEKQHAMNLPPTLHYSHMSNLQTPLLTTTIPGDPWPSSQHSVSLTQFTTVPIKIDSSVNSTGHYHRKTLVTISHDQARDGWKVYERHTLKFQLPSTYSLRRSNILRSIIIYSSILDLRIVYSFVCLLYLDLNFPFSFIPFSIPSFLCLT